MSKNSKNHMRQPNKIIRFLSVHSLCKQVDQHRALDYYVLVGSSYVLNSGEKIASHKTKKYEAGIVLGRIAYRWSSNKVAYRVSKTAGNQY